MMINVEKMDMKINTKIKASREILLSLFLYDFVK